VRRQIVIGCLQCGHCSLMSENTLLDYGLEPGTPIALFVKRLRCQDCGSHSVKAYREEMSPAEWPHQDIAILEDAVLHGGSLKETAALLQRDEEEVDRQARLLGLIDSPPTIPKDL
jgi:hypothetical protein